MIEKKDPETSFKEMMARNERSQLHQAAFSFWRDGNYEYKNHYERFGRFCRWFDPSWTLPNHVQSVVDLFEKHFVSHKIIVTDRGEGVQLHMNPSRNTGDNHKDWMEWKTWSYSICVPFDLDYYDPVVMVYGKYIVEPKKIQYSPTNDFDISKFRAMECEPFSRLSFPSSRYPHGVCSSDNRLFWILNDMQFVDEPPHIEIDKKILSNIEDLEKDMVSVINSTKPNGEKYLQQQFMADLDYFLSYKKPVTELDWTPPGI